MLSKYFQIKTKSEEFKTHIETLFTELKDKKVLLYGAGEGFVALDKIYDFKSKLNVIGIADLKFEKDTKKSFRGFKKISPKNIPSEDFDVVLVTNEYSKKIVKYLKNQLKLECDIKTLFVEDIEDEQINLNYLYKYHFDKTLPKLIKQCKGKKIILYGAGKFLELIYKYFDLSGLDIIAIADKRYANHKENETFLGRKVCSSEEIKDLKPDLVIICTKFYLELLHTIKDEVFGELKVKPLLKKSFIQLMCETWYST